MQLATSDVGRRVQEKLLKDLGVGPSGESNGESRGAAATSPQITEDQKVTASRLIQEAYGRGATQDEIDFYASRLASGDKPLEVADFLKTRPEYMEIQTKKRNVEVKAEEAAARAESDKNLLSTQTEFFNRIQPNVTSAFQRAGRIGSSGLANSLAGVAGDLEKERQSYMSGLGYDAAIRREGYNREDFLNSVGRGYEQQLRQSEPAYQQRFNLQNIGNDLRFGFPMRQLERSYGLADSRLNRAYEVEDYGRQQSDFYRAMGQERKRGREAALYGLAGSLLGSGMQGLTYGLMNRK